MTLHKPEFTHEEQMAYSELGSMVNPFLWVREYKYNNLSVVYCSIQAACYTFRVRFNGEIIAEPYREEGLDVAIEALRDGPQKDHLLIAKAKELLNPQNETYDFTTDDGWKIFRVKEAAKEWDIYNENWKNWE